VFRALKYECIEVKRGWFGWKNSLYITIQSKTKKIFCEHCKIELATQKHHISYFPEKLMNLCFSCHVVIHKCKHPMYDKFKQYEKGDSKMFYGKKYKKSKRKKRFWLDIPGIKSIPYSRFNG